MMQDEGLGTNQPYLMNIYLRPISISSQRENDILSRENTLILFSTA